MRGPLFDFKQQLLSFCCEPRNLFRNSAAADDVEFLAPLCGTSMSKFDKFNDLSLIEHPSLLFQHLLSVCSFFLFK